MEGQHSIMASEYIVFFNIYDSNTSSGLILAVALWIAGAYFLYQSMKRSESSRSRPDFTFVVFGGLVFFIGFGILWLYFTDSAWRADLIRQLEAGECNKSRGFAENVSYLSRAGRYTFHLNGLDFETKRTADRSVDFRTGDAVNVVHCGGKLQIGLGGDVVRLSIRKR